MRDAGAIGAARTRCYTTHENFDDAIVFPNMPGVAHLHQYSGADKVTAAGIDPSSGGSCRGAGVNLSAYWWPALLTPQGQVLRPIYMDWYAKASHYDLNGTPKVNRPPTGLKMLAGDMTRTQANPQGTRYLFWSCGEEDGGQRSAGIPSCPGGLLGAHVYFPQCANGQTDSVDHRSHLSYPVSGACPSTHPVLLPAISFHWYYRNVPAGSKLSCDSPTMAGGYCLHADEIFGWDPAIFQSMLDGCVNRGLSCGSDLTADGRSLGIFNGN